MKVLIIDPWCSDNYNVYTIGLCDGLSKQVELTICTSYYETLKTNKYKIIPTFFKVSDKMKNGFARTIIRGIEYLLAYHTIYRMIQRKHFDVIHVQWALMYPIDTFFLGMFRKHTNKLVYTSHNVIPHINGEKYIDQLKKLHNVFDSILVHGESIKKEYLEYFPEDESKLHIQRHGVHLTQKTTYNENCVDPKIKEYVRSNTGKLVANPGIIFYNKGTDRILNYWKNNKKNSNDKLIVAGKVDQMYGELQEAISDIENYENILYIPRFLTEDEYSYVLSHCDFVVIPYRHASMSGLIYSAAAFAKPVVFTDTGALKEYATDDCGFRAENSFEDLCRTLDKALDTDSNELSVRGQNLNNRIYSLYNWDVIAKKLIKEVYQ